MSEPFLAEIRMVGFNFPPRNWAYCDGSLIPIGQNETLYSILGSAFGGDGRTTFALPDLRGRAAMGVGSGPNRTSTPRRTLYLTYNAFSEGDLRQAYYTDRDRQLSELTSEKASGKGARISTIGHFLGERA